MAITPFASHMVQEAHPYYTGKEIEEKAEEVLSEYCRERICSPGVTPITAIVADYQKKGHLLLVLGADLGTIPGTNHRIIGKFVLDPPAILIDSSITSYGHRFNFTLAHEFGHFLLHRRVVYTSSLGVESLVDSNDDLVIRQGPTTPREWIEWHANRFAAALLMPRSAFWKALIRCQEQSGINNRGPLIVENLPYSRADYYTVTACLSCAFDVSRTAIEHRLKTLGWLNDRRSEGSRSRGPRRVFAVN